MRPVSSRASSRSRRRRKIWRERRTEFGAKGPVLAGRSRSSLTQPLPGLGTPGFPAFFRWGSRRRPLGLVQVWFPSLGERMRQVTWHGNKQARRRTRRMFGARLVRVVPCSIRVGFATTVPSNREQQQARGRQRRCTATVRRILVPGTRRMRRFCTRRWSLRGLSSFGFALDACAPHACSYHRILPSNSIRVPFPFFHVHPIRRWRSTHSMGCAWHTLRASPITVLLVPFILKGGHTEPEVGRGGPKGGYPPSIASFPSAPRDSTIPRRGP